MKLSGPANRQWWWANLWFTVNWFVGALVALLIVGGLRGYPRGGIDALWLVTYMALTGFFAFVWPPIPMTEMAIRDLLRKRREAQDAARFESPGPGTDASGRERPRELGLHVAERHIADRRRGEE